MATALLLIAGVWTVGARAQSTRRWVPIHVFTNTPVADADIVVSDPDGRVVFEKDHATNNRGFYPAEIVHRPKSFRVTVLANGMKLSSDVNDYREVGGEVYVNPVTTMVSRLLDRRPELSLAEARAIIRSFLGMPANTSLGAAMRQGPYYVSPLFSESDFIKQAKAHGGFDSFLESQVTQAIAHPNEAHLFRPTGPGSAGIGSSIAVAVAEELGKSALSWAVGEGMGWAAEAAGLSSPGATKEDIEHLQNQLDDLQSSVDDLSNQLTQSTKAIEQAINYSQYNTLSISALKLAAQVNVVNQNVTDLSDGCPTVPDGEPPVPLSTYCQGLLGTITSQLNESEIDGSFEEFASFLEDTGAVGNKGLLHLFSLCMGQSSHFFRYSDSVKIQDMWGYWDAVEVQAAIAKAERLHLQHAQDDPGGQKVLLRFLGNVNATPPTNGELQNTHNAEAALVWPILPEGTVVNTDDQALWLTVYPGSNNPQYCRDSLTNPPNLLGGIDFKPIPPDIRLQPTVKSSFTSLFRSPSRNQLTSLINGWKGHSIAPGKWIADQSGPKAGDPPNTDKSIGFPVIYTTITGCTTSGPPWVWTYDSIVRGQNYYVFNLSDGTSSDENSSVGIVSVNGNWVYLVSDVAYEFYWFD
ncbi:MAG TPA: hypothetical protein VF018_12525 [Acidobacteriaceae bacterium]